jgi:hypothetical protein
MRLGFPKLAVGVAMEDNDNSLEDSLQWLLMVRIPASSTKLRSCPLEFNFAIDLDLNSHDPGRVYLRDFTCARVFVRSGAHATSLFVPALVDVVLYRMRTRRDTSLGTVSICHILVDGHEHRSS